MGFGEIYDTGIGMTAVYGQRQRPRYDTNTHLTVLSTSDLTNHLVLLLVAPVHSQRLVIPVITRSVDIDIGIDTA
jgi:hypothetical protein